MLIVPNSESLSSSLHDDGACEGHRGCFCCSLHSSTLLSPLQLSIKKTPQTDFEQEAKKGNHWSHWQHPFDSNQQPLQSHWVRGPVHLYSFKISSFSDFVIWVFASFLFMDRVFFVNLLAISIHLLNLSYIFL